MKRLTLQGSLLVIGFMVLAGVPTGAAALPCFTCTAPDGFCVRHTSQVTGGGASCEDNGGGSTCTLFGSCIQTLAVTSATLRPDGLMTQANGLPQLISGWIWSTATPAKKDTFALTAPGEHRSQLFSALFARAPNTGITGTASGDRCQGYVIAVSYTKQQAAALRQHSVTLNI